ncbi:TIGR01620 family protein [Thioclava sp. SK-1]|uniref:YcjF family protein n=1 Tax=Thioclava sp. SK-1 TaxID=1889770 RepID=UPI0008248B5C|nr:TIGR01620 family protein [Thioclava sp. SK-1]OCX64646.1 TIGR01620 family protein [Thioclava sp. SK-1]
MKRPVMIELDEAAENPAQAEPIKDLPDATQDQLHGRAMQIAARLGARPPSLVAKLLWRSILALLGFMASLAAWRFVEGLFASNPILGWIGAGLLACVVIAALIIALREIAAFSRMKRLDVLHREVSSLTGTHDVTRTRKTVTKLSALYAARAEMSWSRKRLAERGPEVIDSDTLVDLAETELMRPLDSAARLEIEAASRSVAATTALVPLALVDVATALIANIRMIRRIAEIYGGRAGSLGAIRLARAVMTHLVATGAVAAGDDLIETVAGGHLAAKLSRRFGEGVVNGALTARVGIAAMEVCRPMPFRALPKPKVTNIIGRSLTGLFGRNQAGTKDS